MRIAVLFSPGAGNARDFRRLGEILAARLAGHEAYVCSGRFGADYLGAASLCSFKERSSYVESVKAATLSLAAKKPDLFVCVGGDGLASYAADTLVRREATAVPMLGIAAGTANVGPIVSVGPTELDRLRFDELGFVRIGAIDVSLAGRHLAYGFNDVVIGTTFLGTVDGRPVSLSARALAERGEQVVEDPDPRIVEEDFAVEKNGRMVPGGLPRPAQIIVAPLGEREFFGRAVAGALCESAYSANKAALALLDSVVVRPSGIERGLAEFARADHLLFGPGDAVVLRGLAARSQVVVDGNPFLRGGADIEFAYRAGLVVAARLDGAAKVL
jgi:hypothetical protein